MFSAGNTFADAPNDRRLLSEHEEASLEEFFSNRPQDIPPDESVPLPDETMAAAGVYDVAPPPSVVDVSTIADQNRSAQQSIPYAGNMFSSGFLANTQTPVRATSTLYNSMEVTSGSYDSFQSATVTSGSYDSFHPTTVTSGSYDSFQPTTVTSGSYDGFQPTTVTSGYDNFQPTTVTSGSYDIFQTTPVTSGSYDSLQATTVTSGPYNSLQAALAASDPFHVSGTLNMTSMLAPARVQVIPDSIANRLTIQTQHAERFSQIASTTTGLVSPRRSLTRPYVYGTDTRFNPFGYTPASRGAEAAIVNRLTDDMHNAIRLDSSAQLTNGATVSIKTETAESAEASGEDEANGPRAKRRKVSTTTSVAFESSAMERISSSTSTASRNRSTADESTPRKRKRSTPAGQGRQRQNLTNEQKRNNHTASEQKRRNVIKGGFDKLELLVPGIKNGNFKKAAILKETTEFLQMLQECNKTHESYIGRRRG
ncbi:uncharacterized protein EI97DRAFT_298733 [Westerdykella ornata]|uniref:BHLH domain-containing protein n=1 Tax=Westerdykella ornata TaxID=318751 RepID=A0A6A6JNX1_WESOR|nr:uncharacterized protein EI97DRAFT_298733 [Westerdykella ornata]KAF2277598.1 hypothetical protein EI97DRAFT_298733 [Westerdykella ornata]